MYSNYLCTFYFTFVEKVNNHRKYMLIYYKIEMVVSSVTLST